MEDGRHREDGGWKTVDRRRGRHQTRERKESNSDELKRLVTTFFVSNIPEGWNSRRLWKAFEARGTLVDAFIPSKKDASGGLFGFVRFLKVPNLQQLLDSMNEMVLQGKKLRVNVARHDRVKDNRKIEVHQQQWKVRSTKEAVEVYRNEVCNFKSFKGVLQDSKANGEVKVKGLGSEEKVVEVVVPNTLIQKEHAWLGSCLVGELKEIELLSKCMAMIHNYGLGECNIRYLGGLSVLLQFNSKAIADCFLTNQRVNWSVWFDRLSKWNNSFVLESRAAWLRIRGVPPNCWDPTVFTCIAEKFGKVLIPFECSVDATDMSYGKICVLYPSLNNITSCKVSVKWKDMQFMVFVSDEGDWRPPQGVTCLDSDTDDESDDRDWEYEEGEILEFDDEKDSETEEPSLLPGEGKTPENAHAVILENEKDNHEEYSANEVQTNWRDEVVDSQDTSVFVENTPLTGGYGGPCGPLKSVGPTQSLEVDKNCDNGPLKSVGLPDLNSPSVENERNQNGKHAQIYLQEKGGKKKIHSVRFKDVLINASLNKKKGNQREKEKDKERRRMVESKDEGRQSKDEGRQSMANTTQRTESSSSSEEYRRTVEIGKALGYQIDEVEQPIYRTLQGDGANVGYL
ncbi:hypothetical protein LXL04_030597 [Taraxacum kok-saghyz]